MFNSLYKMQCLQAVKVRYSESHLSRGIRTVMLACTWSEPSSSSAVRSAASVILKTDLQTQWHFVRLDKTLQIREGRRPHLRSLFKLQGTPWTCAISCLNGLLEWITLLTFTSLRFSLLHPCVISMQSETLCSVTINPREKPAAMASVSSTST